MGEDIALDSNLGSQFLGSQFLGSQLSSLGFKFQTEPSESKDFSQARSRVPRPNSFVAQSEQTDQRSSSPAGVGH